MTEILLALAMTQYPLVWANDYCVYRAYSNHEEAVRLATEATGAPTERAWELVGQNKTWCGDEENE